MSAILILEAITKKETIVVSLYEQGSTVHSFEEISISLSDVHSLCDDIIRILNKFNQMGQARSTLFFDLKRAGQLLFDQLLSVSGKSLLKQTKVKHLLFCLDEQLVSIPWELFFDGEDFLCLKFNTGRQVRTMAQPKAKSPRVVRHPLKMLLMGDPRGDLLHARREIKEIRELLDQQKKVCVASAKVKNIPLHFVKKNIRDYDIVHYAGHADYASDDPSGAGWMFSDGVFKAKDIMMMKSSAPFPLLIFSNSCQSAYQKNMKVDRHYENNIFGVAHSFLLSGVKHVIGTLWKVPDEMSYFFSKIFYQKILKEETLGQAVREARLESIREYGKDNIIWASYILYGDPAACLIPVSLKKKILKNIRDGIKKKYLYIFSLLVFLFGIIFFVWFSPRAFNQVVLKQRFYKMESLYLQGKDEEVISLSKDIIDVNPNFLPAFKILGQVYERQKEYGIALKYYLKALEVSSLYSVEEKLFLNEKVAELYFIQEDVPSSIKYILENVKHYKQQHMTKSLYRSFSFLSAAYGILNDYPQAVGYLELVLTIANERDDRLGMASAYLSFADLYKEKILYEMFFYPQKIPQSVEKKNDYYFKGIDLYEKTLKYCGVGKYPLIHALALQGVGDLNKMKGEMDLAIDYYEKALAVFLSQKSLSSEYNVALAMVYLDLTTLYAEHHMDYKQALEYLSSLENMFLLVKKDEVIWSKQSLVFRDKFKLLLRNHRTHHAWNQAFYNQAMQIFKKF